MRGDCRIEALIRALFYISAAICTMAFAAYITIISRSYFFQDDFLFWPQYSSLDFSALFDPATNFGRPVTRDLYFFLIAHVLGADSSNFFYVNLSVIAVVCVLLYRLLREFGIDRHAAGAAAAIYFYMTPTIPHAAWISNSQHTIAHLLSFWFILSMVRTLHADRTEKTGPAVIYLLAVFSNVLSLFSLVFVGIYAILRHRQSPMRGFLPLMAFLAVLAAITVAWSVAISHSAPVKYRVDLSAAHAFSRARYYDGFLSAGMAGSYYRVLFVAMLALTILNLKRNYLLVLPLVGAFATAFGMLFFLSDKQVLGYMAVPYILFALLLFSNFRPGSFRPGERRSWALLALSFCFLLYSLENGTSQRNDFMSSPFGSGIRELQTAIRNVRISKDTTFCFAPDTLPTHSGTASFWTFLEAGRAFWLVDFGDGYKRQFLYYEDPRCSQPDVVHVTIKQRSATLSVTDIEGPDGVLYPKLQGTSPH